MYFSRVALFVHLHHSIQGAAESCAELANSPIAQRRMFVSEFCLEILKHASTILRANRLDCDCMVDHATHCHHFRTPLSTARMHALDHTCGMTAATVTTARKPNAYTCDRSNDKESRMPQGTSNMLGSTGVQVGSARLSHPTRSMHTRSKADTQHEGSVCDAWAAYTDSKVDNSICAKHAVQSKRAYSTFSFPRDIAKDLHYLRDLCHQYLLPSALAPLRLDVACASLHALLHEPDPIALPCKSWLVSALERQSLPTHHGSGAWTHDRAYGVCEEDGGNCPAGRYSLTDRNDLGQSCSENVSQFGETLTHVRDYVDNAHDVDCYSSSSSHAASLNLSNQHPNDNEDDEHQEYQDDQHSQQQHEYFRANDMCAVRTPIGLVALLSRYRPRMSIEAVAMGLLAGNALLVDGGAALYHTNVEIAHCIRTALRRAGLPVCAVAHVLDGADDGMAQLTREWLQQSYLQHNHCTSVPMHTVDASMRDSRRACSREEAVHNASKSSWSVPDKCNSNSSSSSSSSNGNRSGNSKLHIACTNAHPGVTATSSHLSHSTAAHTSLPDQPSNKDLQSGRCMNSSSSCDDYNASKQKSDAIARQHRHDVCQHYIDAALVCGPPKLYRFACQHSVAIPLINATTSGCSIYVDHSAEFDLSLRTVLDVTTTQTRLRQFGAMDTLIIHEGFPRAAELLNYLAHEGGVRLRGDEAAREAAPRAVLELATDEDYRGESYLAASLTSVSLQSSCKYGYGDFSRSCLHSSHYNNSCSMLSNDNNTCDYSSCTCKSNKACKPTGCGTASGDTSHSRSVNRSIADDNRSDVSCANTRHSQGDGGVHFSSSNTCTMRPAGECASSDGSHTQTNAPRNDNDGNSVSISNPAMYKSNVSSDSGFDCHHNIYGACGRGGLLCVKMVPSLPYAIYLLKNLGYHEGATIISSDERMMREFCRRVDSALVSVNTSISRASAVAAEKSGTNLALSSCKLLGCGPITLTTFTTTKCVVRVRNV